MLVGILFALALGGVAFAFTGGDEKTQKRVAAVAKPRGQARGRAATPQQDAGAEAQECRGHAQGRGEEPRRQERTAHHAPPPGAGRLSQGHAAQLLDDLRHRRRSWPPASAILTHQKPLVIALAVFVVGLGLPRWVLGFLTTRRKKKFTEHFATAIDVIVRSVQVGPSHQRGAAHRGARSPRIRWAANSTIWWKA